MKMAKWRVFVIFFVLWFYNIQCVWSLWREKENKCDNYLRNMPTICKCHIDMDIIVKCVGNLSDSEFSRIGQVMRERHNTIITHHKTGGDTLKSVTSLQIVKGTLSKIYEQDISYVGFLKILNLTHNNLEDLEPGCFKSLSDSLVQLDLSNNHLTVIENYFKEDSNLTNLNLSRNKVHKINFNAFTHLPNLRTLDLSQNQLTTLERDFFLNNNKLQKLNLSDNELRVLYPESFKGLTNLEFLDLSTNKLNEMEFHDALFSDLTMLVGIDISQNNFSRIKESTFENNLKLNKLLILGNPWYCDEDLEWIYLRIEAGTLEITSKFSSWKFDSNTIICRGGPVNMTDKTLTKWMRNMAIATSFARTPVCKICDCINDRSRNGAIVYCNNRNLTELPIDLPSYTLKVDLQDNNIDSLKPHVNSSNWETVSLLHLDRNKIKSLGSLEGHTKFKTVAFLTLTGNELREAPYHLLDKFLGQMSEMRLAQNPWVCNCHTVKFKTLLVRYSKEIKDTNQMVCFSGNENVIGRPITSLENRELCPQSDVSINYLDILNIFMAVLIIIIAAKLGMDYWYRKRTGKFPRFFKIQLK